MIEDKIKENKEADLNNCDENNLFDIIIQLFNELFSKYSLCYYDNIYSETQKRRLNELLVVVGTSCYNFYYEENCPFSFSIINNSIKKLNKNYYFEKKIYDEYENIINHVRNYRELKKFYCDENGLNNCLSSKNSSIFNYCVLEKIVENSDSRNMMNMSFSTNIEIVDNIDFLLNNPNIQSIFIFPIKSSFVSINSSNTFIYKRRKSDYKFCDKKYCYLFYFIYLFDLYREEYMKYLNDDGNMYEGKWRNGVKHGKGKYMK
jgi:hypothetical protein